MVLGLKMEQLGDSDLQDRSNNVQTQRTGIRATSLCATSFETNLLAMRNFMKAKD